jgi:hypothetical protein
MPYKRKYARSSGRSGGAAMSKVARLLQADIRSRNPRTIQRKSDYAFKSGIRQALWQRAQSMSPEEAQQLFSGVNGYADRDAAQIMKIMGKGGYWGERFGRWLGGLTGNDTIKNWMGNAFSSAGDYVSAAIPGGSLIASGAEALAKATGHGSYGIGRRLPLYDRPVRMSGHGAYHMETPSTAIQVGTFSQGDVEHINIKSREYLGAINGASAFTLSTLILNPGLLQTFPQLSKLAMHYEQYQFNGLIFWFHSTSGESTNSADTAIGELMMANQPDSTEANPLNKQQLVRMDSAKQAKPSIDQLHGVECAGAQIKFIRHGDPIEATQDAQRFDYGKFHLAVEGCNAAVTRLGELWVTYDVDLIRSRDSKGQEVGAYRADILTGSNSNLFSLTVPTIKYASLPLTIAGNTVTFPQFVCDGDYQITLILFGIGTANTGFGQRCPQIATVTSCTILQNLNDSAFNASGSPGDNSDAFSVGHFAVRINAPGATQATVTFAPDGVWPASISTLAGALRLVVSRVPQDLLT